MLQQNIVQNKKSHFKHSDNAFYVYKDYDDYSDRTYKKVLGFLTGHRVSAPAGNIRNQ